MRKFSYSKIYEASDFDENDLRYVKNGSKSGSFVLVGSNNRSDLEGSYPKGKVGIWAYGITADGTAITLHTVFEKNSDGMPWGAYSFEAEAFRFVRFVQNPYGETEFVSLPSDCEKH